MINLQSIGRKDDLESLMYIICFLYNGTIPVIDYVNRCINSDDSQSILGRIQQFRKENQTSLFREIKEMLPGSLKSALAYIIQLGHDEKPNYDLIKLFFTSTIEEEQQALVSRLQIENENLARGVLFDDRKDNNEEIKEGQEINDVKSNFSFDF